MVVDHVLPNCHGITAPPQSLFDRFPKRFADTVGWTGRGKLDRRFFRKRPDKVGSHLYGRFCRRSPTPTRPTDHDSSGFQISADGFSALTGLFLYPPWWPT